MENKLKEVRKKRGMTQKELAELSGVSRGTIVAIENGKAKVTTTKTLQKLAKTLNASMKDIFFGKGV